MNFNEQYLKLLEQYQSDLYDYEENQEEDTVVHIPHSLSDLQIKSMGERAKEKITSLSVLDLTKANVSEIEEKIHVAGFLRVYDFLLRIIDYRATPEQEPKLSIDIFRGQGEGVAYGFRLISRYNFKKDSRFSETPLPDIFGGASVALGLRVSQVVEIIRWIQVIEKCGAFI